MRWLLRVVAGLAIIAGLAAAVVLGPDHRVVHEIDASVDTIAVTTAPSVLDWSGVRVEVTVTMPGDEPVFVGFARSVDVDSYLAETRRSEVVDVSGESVELVDHDGDDFLPGAPTALDWWLAADAGLGTATAALTVPDEQVSVAVVGIGDTSLTGAQASVAWGVPGGFWLAIGCVVIGLALGVFSWRRS